MNRFDIFISHHQTDAGPEASLLAEALRNQGFRVFLDVDTHHAGDLTAITHEALKHSKGVVVIIGRNFAQRTQEQSDWVRRELLAAQKLGKDIVPVILEDASFDTEQLPIELSWVGRQRALRYDRSRIVTLVEEITEAFRIRSRAASGPGFAWLLVLTVIAVSLGFAISYAQYKDGEVAMERTLKEAAQKQVQELKQELQEWKLKLHQQ
jgi:hypothetical protein